eukprot:scaffold1259_cov368-Prasinococcus_capsulatus_cf.AAC.5
MRWTRRARFQSARGRTDGRVGKGALALPICAHIGAYLPSPPPPASVAAPPPDQEAPRKRPPPPGGRWRWRWRWRWRRWSLAGGGGHLLAGNGAAARGARGAWRWGGSWGRRLARAGLAPWEPLRGEQPLWPLTAQGSRPRTTASEHSPDPRRHRLGTVGSDPHSDSWKWSTSVGSYRLLCRGPALPAELTPAWHVLHGCSRPGRARPSPHRARTVTGSQHRARDMPPLGWYSRIRLEHRTPSDISRQSHRASPSVRATSARRWAGRRAQWRGTAPAAAWAGAGCAGIRAGAGESELAASICGLAARRAPLSPALRKWAGVRRRAGSG